MEILFAILLYMGYHFNPELPLPSTGPEAAIVEQATVIRDNNWYTSHEAEGVIIVDDINPEE